MQNEEAPRQRYLEALERIEQHRKAILERRSGRPLELDPVELINQMRDERDAQIIGNITRRSH